MSLFDELKSLVGKELNAADLGKLKSAFDEFIVGNADEKAAATAIAANVRNATEAYLDGTLSRHSFEFVLEHSKDAALMLAEAKSIRLKKAAIKVFFNVVITVLTKKL